MQKIHWIFLAWDWKQPPFCKATQWFIIITYVKLYFQVSNYFPTHWRLWKNCQPGNKNSLVECLFFFFNRKIMLFLLLTSKQNKALDVGQGLREWNSSSNNKEGGCSFVHLIYRLIWRIIKRLPSGCLLQHCWGKRWMAVVNGCQDADLPQGQVWGTGTPGAEGLGFWSPSLASPVS